jgi:hypothetical protein
MYGQVENMEISTVKFYKIGNFILNIDSIASICIPDKMLTLINGENFIADGEEGKKEFDQLVKLLTESGFILKVASEKEEGKEKMTAAEVRKTTIYRTAKEIKMPPEIKSRVLKGIIDAAKNGEKTTFEGDTHYLYASFLWEATKEGSYFWSGISNKYFLKGE